MTMWGGRFRTTLHPLAARLNASLPFDWRLAEVDVRASQAWARALLRAGQLTTDECETLCVGLEKILEEFDAGSFVFSSQDEDIHSALERRLGELIGPVAGKLHTGRSRNDQVVTDFRLWLMAAGQRLDNTLHGLQAALLARAEHDFGVIIPGYTHCQQAQPILLSHWWLAHFWAFQRDRVRLSDILQHTSVLPLGSGALAGTGFPIDRAALAAELGFSAPAPNSLDAVADRDFAAEFLFWAALLAVHLSRLAEALILYSTREFGFITLDDAYSTGSSLMPQKKNPDLLELTRAKSASLIGLLTGFLTMLKALPSAYDKDLQEDKPPVFAAVDLLELLLPVVQGVISSLKVNVERCRAALDPAALATDLADALVERGLPFRQAHTLVGRAVRRAEELGLSLSALPPDELAAIHPDLDAAIVQTISPESSLARRAGWGGTAPASVQEQIVLAKNTLAQHSPPGRGAK
jgi:argininosuccinate lyase